jgi:hypothetical protein
MKKIFVFTVIFISLSTSDISAQHGFTRQLNVQVRDALGNLQKLPWAGGLNYPLFSEFDFDQDGTMDLLAVDRATSGTVIRFVPFLNSGTPNTIDLSYAPQYSLRFPRMRYWALAYDYNCDGRNDLFGLNNFFGGIEVYRNDSIPNGFQFTMVNNSIQSNYGSTTTNISVGYQLFPALSDLDNDGDMDILAWNGVFPGLIEYDKNISIESGFGCDSLKYNYVTSCWGSVRLPVAVNCADTGVHCRTGFYPATGAKSFNMNTYMNEYDQSDAARHDDTMSSIGVFDVEGDGDKDLLVGGLGDLNIQLLRNGGIPVAANIDSVDCNFPSYDTDPVSMVTFPVAAVIDLNNDGKKDMLCVPTFGRDFDGITYYEDTSSSPNITGFHYQQDAFLQDEMIETGSGSYPAFFDYDNDGLKDLIIGNYSYYQGTGIFKSGLSLYRNIGTTTVPSFQLITRDFTGMFNATFCSFYGNDVHPTFGDIDGDGDKDMLVGDFCGALQLFLNNGSNNLTSFGSNGNPSVPNYMGIDIGNSAAPQFIDLDRDGKLDLIIGKRNGFIDYFHNNGTTSNAVFTSTPTQDSLGYVDASFFTAGYACPFVYDDSGSYKLIVGNEQGYVFRYGNIDGNLTGTFSIIDTIINGEEGTRTCPGMGDVNGDGLEDFLVGNYAGGVALFYMDNPVGIQALTGTEAGPGMEIFPNPANGQTEIFFSNLKAESKNVLTVYDAAGQIIRAIDCSSQKLIFDVSTLNAGVYLLQLVDGKHTVTRKLLVY